MIEIKKGVRIAVGDERKKASERVIAEGVVQKISEQEGVKYAHLNTGFYLVIFPLIKEG